MTERIRYGVIGTGMMGCEHLRNLLEVPGAEITALSDPVAASLDWGLATVGDRQPRPATFADHRDLLGSGLVDAVVIASPNHTHVGVLRDVWDTDLHVLVEKPLCTNVEDCDEVVERARRHRGVVWVGLEYRFMPPVARFLAEVHAGTAGRLRMLAIREHRFPFLPKVGNWNRFSRNTGGTLVEKCCHFFDLMRLAAGADPVRIYATGGQDVNHLDEVYPEGRPDILDNAFVLVDFANGVRACLDLCMFADVSRHEQELVAVGDAGKLEAFVPAGQVVVADRRSRTITEIDASGDERIAHVGFHHGSSYLEHLAFAEAVRTGGPPAVSVFDGWWSVAMGVAAHRSIDEGRPVELAGPGR